MPIAAADRVTLSIGGQPVAELDCISWSTTEPRRAPGPTLGTYSGSASFTIPMNRRFKGRAGEAFRRRQAYRTIRSLGL